MRRNRLHGRGIIVTMLLASMTQSVGAAECALPNEYRALGARVIQTRMMVTALACGSQTEYNTVVRGMRPALAEQAIALRRYFARHFGRRAEARMDQFITRLANEESSRSNANRSGYCAAGTALFQHLNVMSTRHFSDMLDDVALGANHRVKLCSHDALRVQVAATETSAKSPRAAVKATGPGVRLGGPAADALPVSAAESSSHLSAQ